MGQVHPNARPFAWAGTKEITCLLVHGFTGSPSELRPLARYLESRGYGGSALLLPGHGTRPEDMALTKWTDWYGAVEAEYLKLKKEHEKVVPIGFSMGGILVLHLAASYTMPGIAALSSPIYIGNRKAYFAPLLKYFYKYRQKPVTPKNMTKIRDEDSFSYDTTPIASLASLLQLIKAVKGELPGLQMPALIIQSRQDRTVNPKSAQFIYDHLGSSKKQLIWLEHSGHVITRGPEQETVFQAVEEFMAGL